MKPRHSIMFDPRAHERRKSADLVAGMRAKLAANAHDYARIPLFIASIAVVLFGLVISYPG